MTCEEARATYLAGERDPRTEDHLTACARCQSVMADLAAVRKTLGDEAMWEEPGPGLEDRLVSLIAGSAPQSTSRHRRGWWAMAAAVGLVIVAAGGFALTRPRAADWEVTLPGTSAAPAANGIVRGWNEPGGTRLEFAIEGLPDAPTGSIYEVWFSREAIHISAGTFSTGGEIDMWAGIARRDFPRIWITLEQIDTDESPSTLTVMDTAETAYRSVERSG